MKKWVIFLITIANLSTAAHASACDRSGVPAHAQSPEGKILIEVLFKPGTKISDALTWASQFGEAKAASRRVPGIRVAIECMESVRGIAVNENVQAISFAPPSPVTFPGATVR